jgi:hypothetical protein
VLKNCRIYWHTLFVSISNSFRQYNVYIFSSMYLFNCQFVKFGTYWFKTCFSKFCWHGSVLSKWNSESAHITFQVVMLNRTTDKKCGVCYFIDPVSTALNFSGLKQRQRWSGSIKGGKFGSWMSHQLASQEGLCSLKLFICTAEHT